MLKQKYLHLLPLFYVLGIPLGAAAQNIILTLICGCVLFFGESSKNSCSQRLTYAYLLFLCSFVLSGVYNQEVTWAKIAEFFLGYAPLLFVPVVASTFKDKIQNQSLVLMRLLITLSVFMAVICASQMLFGWKISGISIVAAEFRARGFYSHPLTLAYVIILIWPVVSHLFLIQTRSWPNVAMWFSVLVMLLTSNSRVVILLSMLNFIFNFRRLLDRRERHYLIVAFIATFFVIAFVPNPIRTNVINTVHGQADHLAKDYPDDRVAFWHAHWELFKSRPILGLGPHFDKSHLQEAYQKIGLEGFSKKYSAHNAFLEIAVTGGICALVFFVLWLWQINRCIYLLSSRSQRGVAQQVFWLFLVACLTQNAWQDGEVRYMIFGLTSVLFSLIAKDAKA